MTHVLISLVERFPLDETLFDEEIMFISDEMPPTLSHFSSVALIEQLQNKPDQLVVLPFTEIHDHTERWVKQAVAKSSFPMELVVWNRSFSRLTMTEIIHNELTKPLIQLTKNVSHITIDVTHLARPSAIALGVSLAQLLATSSCEHIQVWDAELQSRGMDIDQYCAQLACAWDSKLVNKQNLESTAKDIQSSSQDKTTQPSSTDHSEQESNALEEESQTQASELNQPIHFEKDREFQQLYKFLEDLVLSLYKPEKKAKANQLQATLIAKFPESKEIVQDLRKRLDLANRYFDDAYHCGARGKKLDPQLLKKTRALNLKQEKQIIEKLKTNHATGFSRSKRRQQENRDIKAGRAPSKVKLKAKSKKFTHAPLSSQLPTTTRSQHSAYHEDLHPNDIRGLDPQKEWVLLLDETGRDFAEGKGHVKPSFVSLLIPNQIDVLPKLSRAWHASQQDNNDTVDELVQSVLDAPVGVLGVCLEAIPKTVKERWFDGMVTLIDLVLRLLPLSEQTKLIVKIENRAEYTPKSNMKEISRILLNRLGRAWPERAKLIDLDIHIIRKEADLRNGYVDALAFTWGSPTPSSRARLAQSQLLHNCLITGDSAKLTKIWDAYDQQLGPRADRWVELATHPAAQPNSPNLVSDLLHKQSEYIRTNAHLWGKIVQESLQKELDKSLTLPLLGQLLDWIQISKPKESELPESLELMWLTVKLARSNHSGEVLDADAKRRQELSELIYEEDARIACNAKLHEAVTYTNQFEYQKAQKVLEPWAHKPTATIGLRYKGRVLSSLGQHAAFLGELKQAQDYFEQALSLFKRLSYNQEGDCKQSNAYLLTSLIDDPSYPDNLLKEKIFEHLGGAPEEAIKSLAESGTSKQYDQHIFLRWLVFRGDESSQNLYLKYQEQWQQGEAHPWELIDAYRSILLMRKQSANLSGQVNPLDVEVQERFLSACNVAFNSGPTVLYIGVVLRTWLLSVGVEWPEADVFFNKIEQSLPRLTAQIEKLRVQPPQSDVGSYVEPQKLGHWFDQFLKFNFR